MIVSIRKGMTKSRDELVSQLVTIQYERNDIDFQRNRFRVRGDVVEIFPVSSNETAVRVEFFGDEIDRISEINVVTGEILRTLAHVAIFPASHYITGKERLNAAIDDIEQEMRERVEYFKALKTIQGFSQGASRGLCRLRCSTSSRRTFC